MTDTTTRAAIRPYTRAEAAEILRVSERTVVRMLDSHELKPTRKRKRGRILRITAASVHRVLDEGAS